MKTHIQFVLRTLPGSFVAKPFCARLAVSMLSAFLSVPTARAGSGLMNADFKKHVEALEKRKPGKEFSIVIQKPFVVIGDSERHVLRDTWARGTIKWTVEKLKAGYFSKDPDHIIDIWLFKKRKFYANTTSASPQTAKPIQAAIRH